MSYFVQHVPSGAIFKHNMMLASIKSLERAAFFEMKEEAEIFRQHIKQCMYYYDDDVSIVNEDEISLMLIMRS